MAFCSKCGNALPENANVCPACGAPVNAPAAPVVKNTDHTAEFDAKDISDNKVIAMLIYLLPVVGILIALLSQSGSKFVAFHLRQALKLLVCDSLVTMASLLLAITVIVPIAGAICLAITAVLRIIAFFQICGGKAKEIPIVSGFGFMK